MYSSYARIASPESFERLDVGTRSHDGYRGATADYLSSLSYELDLADDGLDDGLVWVDGAALADDDLECDAAEQVVELRGGGR